MAAWHRSVRADIGLRVAGTLACLVAWRAFATLTAQPAVRDHLVHPMRLALATLGFLAASAGGALVLLGRHLFDEVEVSARWRSTRLPAR